MKPDRVIGVDPGLLVTGVCIVDRGDDGTLRAQHIGTIRPRRADTTSYKLRSICRELMALIESFDPHCLAVEETFFHKNVKSALALGQARGAALLAAAEAEIDVMELSPKTVKQAAVGNGSAAKEQVASMITSILKLPEVPESTDACDAAAVALAALHRRSLPVELAR